MNVQKIITIIIALAIANVSFAATLQLNPGAIGSQAYKGLLNGYYMYDIKLYISPQNNEEVHSAGEHSSFDPYNFGNFDYFQDDFLGGYINSYTGVSSDS